MFYSYFFYPCFYFYFGFFFRAQFVFCFVKLSLIFFYVDSV